MINLHLESDSMWMRVLQVEAASGSLSNGAILEVYAWRRERVAN
jgi:hypothetical protein